MDSKQTNLWTNDYYKMITDRPRCYHNMTLFLFYQGGSSPLNLEWLVTKSATPGGTFQSESENCYFCNHDLFKIGPAGSHTLVSAQREADPSSGSMKTMFALTVTW